MLTKDENEALVRVGPGTPGGELLRRYWHPVAIASELTDENPTLTVRILGETLVLFRDLSGRVGLLEDKCAHRNASLLYGRVEERGISCVYHGWLFDTAGNILETPPEKNDAILSHVKQTSYPVERFLGMYWAYLGPLPAPVIPHYDTFTRSDGKRSIVVHPDLDANWFQAMENSCDPAHLQVLHQEYIGRGRQPVNTTRGFTDDVKDFSFYVNDIGIMKHREYHNGSVEEHPLIFPNILRQGPSTQIRIPIDDEHTRHIHVLFDYTGKIEDNEADPPVEYLKPYKNPPDKLHPFTRFDGRSVLAQDHLAWETQGPITDRTKEHLSYSDRGVALLRKVMFENMEKVKRGEDPLGVFRDPNHEMIDTNLVDGLFGADGRARPSGEQTPDTIAVQSYRQ